MCVTVWLICCIVYFMAALIKIMFFPPHSTLYIFFLRTENSKDLRTLSRFFEISLFRATCKLFSCSKLNILVNYQFVNELHSHMGVNCFGEKG